MTDTITLPRSVVQGALDALRDYKRSDDDRVSVAMGILQDALREALEQPQQEPEAIRHSFDGYGWKYVDSGFGSNWQEWAKRYADAQPLYTAPPRQELQEPVAWVHGDEYGDACHWVGGRMPPAGTKLYTAPPRREWVSLTDYEIVCIEEQPSRVDFARAIEAKLKDKNA